MKKIMVSFFITISLMSTFVYAGTLVKKVYFSSYPIIINDKEYSSETPILNYQDRTYVSLREFSEMVGVEVDFKDNIIIIKSTNRQEVKKDENIKDNITNEKSSEDIQEEKNIQNNYIQNSQIVYITKSGSKYHISNTCNGATYYQISLQEALEKGYTPCLRCSN